MYKLIVFVILMACVNGQCGDTYMNYVAKFNPVDIYNPFVNTGAGYNNLGYYETCLENVNNKYILLTCMKGKREIFLGLCLPEECVNRNSLKELTYHLVNVFGIDVETVKYYNSELENGRNRYFDIVKIAYLIVILWYFGFSINRIIGGGIDSHHNGGVILTENKIWTFVSKNHEILNKPAHGNHELDIFKGLRCLFTIFALIYCYFLYAYKFPSKNADANDTMFKDVRVQFIFNGLYILHSFLGISGFLQAYRLSKRSYEGVDFIKEGVMKYILRIWPVYLFTLIFYTKYFVYFIDGPVAGLFYNKEVEGLNSQWPFLLLNGQVDNLFWIISLEMKLYFMGLLIYYMQIKLKGLFDILFTISLFSFIYIEYSYICNHNYYPMNITDVFSSEGFYQTITANYYHYFVGYYIGLNYTRIKSTISGFNKRLLILCLFGYCLLFYTIWSPYLNNFTNDSTFRYKYSFILTKLTVPALFMSCIPLMLEKCYILGGWLGNGLFTYLNKLVVSMFLVQQLVIRFVLLNTGTSIVYHSYFNLLTLLGIASVSYIISVPVALVFEIPYYRYFHKDKTIKIE
jgi:hypothetical protein